MTNRTLLGTAAALIGFVMMVATPASADLLDDITQAKKIRISTDVAIPPSGMMDSSMKPTGSDVEVACSPRIGGSSSNSSRPPARRASPTS